MQMYVCNVLYIMNTFGKRTTKRITNASVLVSLMVAGPQETAL